MKRHKGQTARPLHVSNVSRQAELKRSEHGPNTFFPNMISVILGSFVMLMYAQVFIFF